MQACVTYAAALEKQACALAGKLVQQDLEQLQNMPEQHAAAAALYRKAAGVYDYASEQYVSQLSGDKQADRCSHLAATQLTLMTALLCHILLALQTSRIKTWHGCGPLKDGTGTSAGGHCPSCTGQEHNAICSCISLLRGHRYESISELCTASSRPKGAHQMTVLA